MPRKGQTLWNYNPREDLITQIICTKGTFPPDYTTPDGSPFKPSGEIYDTHEAAVAHAQAVRERKLQQTLKLADDVIRRFKDSILFSYGAYCQFADTIRTLGGEPPPWPGPVPTEE